MDRAVAAALLMERIVRETYEDRASSAVQPLQWSILRYLSSAPTAEARVATIAKYLGTNHAPISRAAATLIERGLVEKSGGPNPNRTAPMRLTVRGKALLQSDPILKVADRILMLPEDERRVLERALSSLALSRSYEFN